MVTIVALTVRNAKCSVCYIRLSGKKKQRKTKDLK